VNGKRIELIVKEKETFEELNKRIGKESDVLPELSFLCIGDKEVNESRTMDEMDVSDGCVIVQKMSPLANLLKSDTLTPSVISSIVEYIETVEILKVERILTHSFFGRLSEMMNEKKDKYYSIVSILTSIAYRYTISRLDENALYAPMNECGIIMMLRKECEKLIDCDQEDGEKKSEEKDIVILGYSLAMRIKLMESSLLKKIFNYLVKMIEKCVVDLSLLNVGMKAAVALYGLRCCLLLSLSFCYSIFSTSSYSKMSYHNQNRMNWEIK
jgi:hypothetical protein